MIYNNNISSNLILKKEKEEHGEYYGVPDGAIKLGCGNCRQIDMKNHPEMGTLYCAVCPVTRRQRLARAKRNRATYYRWQGEDIPV